MQAQDFLVELGTEELPPKALKKLAEAFLAGVEGGLKDAGLSYAKARYYAAPRRLAVLVEALAAAVVEAYGRIDVLVNNAGVQVNVGLLDLQTRHWDLTMRVNLRGPFLCCKYLAPIMVQQSSGSIINITSGAAERVRPNGISYSVTKAGLNMMTFGLAQELEEHGIAVNALNPGGIKTEGAVLVRPADFDWTGWESPEVVGEASAWLAIQNAKTFTGRVVDRAEFGKTWGV